MPTKSAHTFTTDLSVKAVARVFMTTLRRCQWHVSYVDEETGIITAEQKTPQNIMGKMWHYNFTVTIRWKEAGGISTITIEVNELSYMHSEADCKKKVHELASGFAEDGQSVFEAQKKATKGARWAKPSELKRAGYLTKRIDPRSLLITGDSANYLALPDTETNRHALVCGPTGTGKSTGIFVPNLIERTSVSALVTEATGAKGVAHLYGATSGYRLAHGHRIYYFNPDDLTSDRVNPLDFVDTYSDARRLCEIIMQSTTLSTHRGDQSWEMSEKMLLTALILHVVSQRAEGKANFGYVADLFESGAEGIQKEVASSDVAEVKKAVNKFMSTTTPPFRNLVANGVINRLDLWNQPRIRALTEKTDLDLDAISSGLFTIYLATPSDKPEFKPLAAMMLNLMLSVVSSRQLAHPVALFLDEFTNFGYVRGMPAKLTILRHDKVPVVLGVQDFVQLKNLYGEEAKLLVSQPATKLFFKTNDHDTAKQLSQMLGEAQDTDVKVTSSGHLKDNREKEPLLAVDELLNLGVIDETRLESEGGKPNMIAFLPSTRPIQVKALSWENYVPETNPVLYPLPVRRLLEVDETLGRSPRQGDKDGKENGADALDDADQEKSDQEAEAAETDTGNEASGNEDDEETPSLGFLQW
ncbi:MAG: type IV secretory system conjugative DNA transfer family protein [Cyanobacteria bacterium SZAS LIN-3]|nr:type IV secretory system conjugative DNA transfer family protein [Cyanobacteria bacterium SZAS LIN-3]